MSSKLAKSLWKYKGEAADYAYYRQRDKVTPDDEVRTKLELLHSWYPDKTLAEMQGKDEEIRNRFLSFFPKADMNQFELRSHTDSGTNVFFGAWAIFGDNPTDESKLADPNVIKALGLSGSFPPKLIQTGANYSFPAKKGQGIATDIQIYSSPSNSFMIKFRDVFKEQASSSLLQKSVEFGQRVQTLSIGRSSSTLPCGVQQVVAEFLLILAVCLTLSSHYCNFISILPHVVYFGR